MKNQICEHNYIITESTTSNNHTIYNFKCEKCDEEISLELTYIFDAMFESLAFVVEKLLLESKEEETTLKNLNFMAWNCFLNIFKIDKCFRNLFEYKLECEDIKINKQDLGSLNTILSCRWINLNTLEVVKKQDFIVFKCESREHFLCLERDSFFKKIHIKACEIKKYYNFLGEQKYMSEIQEEAISYVCKDMNLKRCVS